MLVGIRDQEVITVEPITLAAVADLRVEIFWNYCV